MKRLFLALGLLVAVAGLCIASLAYQQRQIDRLLNMADGLEMSYRNGNLEAGVQQAKSLAQEYRRCARAFSCFMSHNELTSSLDTVVTLAASLEEDNPEEFLLELAKFRQELTYLRQIEVPRLHNIL